MFRRLTRLLRSSVIAHTKDGRSLEGVLTGEHRDVIVLASASFLMEDGRREALRGDVVILRENVSFLQVNP